MAWHACIRLVEMAVRTRMRRSGARQGSLLVLALLAATACGTSTASESSVPSHVPVEFRHACGHPHARVEVRAIPVTVRHADCDLTGVQISYKTYGGAYVPRRPNEDYGLSSGLQISTNDSMDVTVRANGPLGDQQ